MERKVLTGTDVINAGLLKPNATMNGLGLCILLEGNICWRWRKRLTCEIRSDAHVTDYQTLAKPYGSIL